MVSTLLRFFNDSSCSPSSGCLLNIFFSKYCMQQIKDFGGDTLNKPVFHIMIYMYNCT